MLARWWWCQPEGARVDGVPTQAQVVLIVDLERLQPLVSEQSCALPVEGTTSVLSQSMSVATHHEWSVGQMRLTDGDQTRSIPGQLVTATFGASRSRYSRRRPRMSAFTS